MHKLEKLIYSIGNPILTESQNIQYCTTLFRYRAKILICKSMLYMKYSMYIFSDNVFIILMYDVQTLSYAIAQGMHIKYIE